MSRLGPQSGVFAEIMVWCHGFCKHRIGQRGGAASRDKRVDGRSRGAMRASERAARRARATDMSLTEALLDL